jgi:DNA polymerase-3 subunit delta
MEFLKFIEEVNRGMTPAPACFFREAKEGAAFLVEEAWLALRDRLVPPKARSFNGEKLTAAHCEPSDVLSRLRTVSMFGPLRLVMIEGVEAWKKDQKKELLVYFKRPNPKACLVISASGKKKDTAEIQKAVEEAGGWLVDFEPPTEYKAPNWLVHRARTLGRKIDKKAAQLLVDRVGADLYRLNAELDKAAIYAGEGKVIRAEHVRDLVAPQKNHQVWDIMKFVSQGRPLDAVNCVRNLLLAGQSDIMLVGLLAREVRLLWQVKDALERKVPTPQILKLLGIQEFVLKRLSAQARVFTHKDLARYHRLLCEIDLQLKSTQLDSEKLLESFVLRLCSPEGSRLSTRRD